MFTLFSTICSVLLFVVTVCNKDLQHSLFYNNDMTVIPIRVLTHNIRYATTSPVEGEEPWSIRKTYMLNELRFNTAHNPEAFICCQEVLHEQLEDLLEGLNTAGDNWTYIGVGRDDGKEAGEYSPIFYRPTIWQLLNFTTVWMSPTPDVPSIGWDAGSIRIVTIGKFLHLETQTEILAMNTHLDNVGTVSRLNSAKILADRAETFSQPDLPVLLTGDFNSETNQEAYQYITQQAPFADSYDKVPLIDHYGNNDTFTGFGYDGELPSRIDFIFTRYEEGNASNTPWVVQNYAVLQSRFDDGVYNSDHRAVVADLMLTRNQAC